MNTHLIKQTPIIMGMNAVYVCPVCKNYVLITSAVQDTDGLMKHEQCTREKDEGRAESASRWNAEVAGDQI